MTEQRTILVTGATGKQGRGVLDAIAALPTQNSSMPFHILAMVRDPTSAASQKLAKLPNVSVVKGDFNDSSAVFTNYGKSIWGVYSVQINSDEELVHGKGLINAAVTHGVRHFVYSSGERGGPERSDRDPTNVKNFAVKFEIEQYLKSVCQARQGTQPMTYTILRPVSFFENQATDIHGSGFGRMWMQIGNGDKPLQMISVRDIGWFAAQSFANPESPKFRNAALSLAGDELSAKQAEKTFKEITGKKMPLAPCIIGKGLKYWHQDTLGDMFAWFEKEGYGADVKECRTMNPNMLDYPTWLKQYSGFV